jgi:hypothetical protein
MGPGKPATSGRKLPFNEQQSCAEQIFSRWPRKFIRAFLLLNTQGLALFGPAPCAVVHLPSALGTSFALPFEASCQDLESDSARLMQNLLSFCT